VEARRAPTRLFVQCTDADVEFVVAALAKDIGLQRSSSLAFNVVATLARRREWAPKWSVHYGIKLAATRID